MALAPHPDSAYANAHARGLTAQESADLLRVSATAVRLRWRKLNLAPPKRSDPRPHLPPPPPVPPPTRAMLALAEFDPVIARCVAVRLNAQKERGDGE